MSMFQQAAELNNNGIEALAKGDRTKAIDSMATSIRIMKSELANPRNKGGKPNCSMTDLVTMEIPDMFSSDNAIFKQAIHIPTTGEQTDVDIQVYSAAVIFNLAFAHHCGATQDNSAWAAKAEKLYTMAMRLLDSSVLHLKAAVVIKLATINNLAQLQIANGHFEHAQEGIAHLSNFMRNANGSLLEEPRIVGLLMNALLLKAPLVAPAA